jgi:hypothetical protein
MSWLLIFLVGATFLVTIVLVLQVLIAKYFGRKNDKSQG